MARDLTHWRNLVREILEHFARMIASPRNESFGKWAKEVRDRRGEAHGAARGNDEIRKTAETKLQQVWRGAVRALQGICMDYGMSRKEAVRAIPLDCPWTLAEVTGIQDYSSKKSLELNLGIWPPEIEPLVEDYNKFVINEPGGEKRVKPLDKDWDDSSMPEQNLVYAAAPFEDWARLQADLLRDGSTEKLDISGLAEFLDGECKRWEQEWRSHARKLIGLLVEMATDLEIRTPMLIDRWETFCGHHRGEMWMLAEESVHVREHAEEWLADAWESTVDHYRQFPLSPCRDRPLLELASKNCPWTFTEILGFEQGRTPQETWERVPAWPPPVQEVRQAMIAQGRDRSVDRAKLEEVKQSL